MSGLEDIALDYRVGLLRYLPRRDGGALASGYEIGRSAVVAGVSVLDLARIHHEVLFEVVRDTPSDALDDVAAAALEFFLEVLGTYDMTQRGYPGGE